MTDIVIYGRGKTGQSLKKLLKKQGKNAIFYDDSQGFDISYNFNPQTTVLLSPGVKPTAKGITLAKKCGAKVLTELEYCFPLCKAPIVSVTGTNGKTTTCELIYHILKSAGKNAHLLGNGGVPFAERVLECQPQDVVVLESSSFQLNDCANFQPKVSVLTNLAVDHLDYHKSIADYSLAKQNNFVHQSADQFAIFNADDKNAMALAQKCKAHTLFYSVSNSNANCYIVDGNVHLNVFGKNQVCKGDVLLKMFKHNQSNCLSAMLACSILGVTLEQSLQAIGTFAFSPHRMQVVANFCGVTFVDDSKGTNVHATVFACQSTQGNVALILGGSQKGYQFDEIFRALPTGIKYVCATGQTAMDIFHCGKKHGKIVHVFDNLKECVKASFDAVKHIGGTVLMSNACASFDKFSGYAERGNHFQQLVEELKIESQV